MNISRLDFLRGSFSAAGLAAFGGVLPAKLFAGSAGTPNLVFGVVTDIHISLSVDKGVKRFEGAEMFRRALEYFRSQGVDGVAMCGDMADHGFINELEEVGRIWHEVFPGDRLPDGDLQVGLTEEDGPGGGLSSRLVRDAETDPPESAVAVTEIEKYLSRAVLSDIKGACLQ